MALIARQNKANLIGTANVIAALFGKLTLSVITRLIDGLLLSVKVSLPELEWSLA